jgi:hypothetical protein
MAQVMMAMTAKTDAAMATMTDIVKVLATERQQPAPIIQVIAPTPVPTPGAAATAAVPSVKGTIDELRLEEGIVQASGHSKSIRLAMNVEAAADGDRGKERQASQIVGACAKPEAHAFMMKRLETVWSKTPGTAVIMAKIIVAASSDPPEVGEALIARAAAFEREQPAAVGRQPLLTVWSLMVMDVHRAGTGHGTQDKDGAGQ